MIIRRNNVSKKKPVPAKNNVRPIRPIEAKPTLECFGVYLAEKALETTDGGVSLINLVSRIEVPEGSLNQKKPDGTPDLDKGVVIAFANRALLYSRLGGEFDVKIGWRFWGEEEQSFSYNGFDKVTLPPDVPLPLKFLNTALPRLPARYLMMIQWRPSSGGLWQNAAARHMVEIVEKAPGSIKA